MEAQNEEQPKKEEELEIQNPPSLSTDFNDLPVVEKHRRIELFETRIIDGIIESNPHPFEAVEFARTKFIDKNKKRIKMSQEETDRYDNYEPEKTTPKIPNFWPKRVWDKPEHYMTNAESILLKSRINEMNQIESKDSFKFVQFPLPYHPVCPRMNSDQDPITQHNLTLSMLDHGTDSDTDQDIF